MEKKIALIQFKDEAPPLYHDDTIGEWNIDSAHSQNKTDVKYYNAGSVINCFITNLSSVQIGILTNIPDLILILNGDNSITSNNEINIGKIGIFLLNVEGITKINNIYVRKNNYRNPMIPIILTEENYEPNKYYYLYIDDSGRGIWIPDREPIMTENRDYYTKEKKYIIIDYVYERS